MSLISKAIAALGFSLVFAVAHAAEMKVVPSSTEITEDENLRIDITIVTDQMGGSIGKPEYKAPGFDEVNVFARSTGIESSIINGVISVRQTQTVTLVLHPKQQGTLKISDITAEVNGKKLQASDVTIQVRPSGSLAQNTSPSYPRPGNLPGGGTRGSKQQTSFFIKTEPSKLKAYKGEQILLTYALYTQVPILNVQVERYPNITGFLKEDVDIPLMNQRWNWSPAVVNGQEYQRTVLAQYAVYPVKDGQLTIEPFTGKVMFRARQNLMDDDEDPFGINTFFRAMQTSTAVRSSDRVAIEVQPLPAAGQPANFSGLVGDFNITAVVDKYSVKMGEPINVKVKVEGDGHAGSLERLAVDWPKDFELYEDKSTTNFLRTGHSERLFEYIVIPKVKGKYQIPPIELSMFHPEANAYKVEKTQPIDIEVLEGSLGNVYIAKTNNDAPKTDAPKEDIRYWMEASPSPRAPALKYATRGIAVASMAFAFMSLWTLAGSGREISRQEQRSKRNKALLAKVKALTESTAPASKVLAEVENALGQFLEHKYGFQIGSLTRSQIKQALLDHFVDEATAARIEILLERCENIRFMPGGTTDDHTARSVSSELQSLIEHIG